MQQKEIAHEAMKRFRISRSEYYNSFEFSRFIITNDMVAKRAEAMAKDLGGHPLEHVEKARKDLEEELASAAEAKTSEPKAGA